MTDTFPRDPNFELTARLLRGTLCMAAEYEGQLAAMKGQGANDNPYSAQPADADKADAWHNGWWRDSCGYPMDPDWTAPARATIGGAL